MCQSLEKLEKPPVVLPSISKILENLEHFSFFALLNLCPLPLQHHQCCQSLEYLENCPVLLSISKSLENLEHFSFFA
jgi:hypothetical protein